MTEPLVEPSFKRALTCAVIAAVMHTAAWAGYVTHLQEGDYQQLERRPAVIQWLDYAKQGPDGRKWRYFSVYLKMQLLASPPSETQLVQRSTPRPEVHAYFTGHHAGDVVNVWVDRRTGQIVDIFLPDAPAFWRLFRTLLPFLGTGTFVLALMLGVVLMCPRVVMRTPGAGPAH